MENILLVVHLILALCLIGVVLLQRSEGGGLGIGGGGGGAVSSRGITTAMGKLTWIFAVLFICTSLGLTIIAAQNSASSSVLDRITDTQRGDPEPTTPSLPLGEDLLPPTAGDAPLVPRAE